MRKTQLNRADTQSDSDRKYRPYRSYLVGRLRIIKTQRKSFRGREGFAIAVEHLEAKFGEAIITIFVSTLLQMDVSVSLLASFSARHYARSPERVCES